MLAQTAEQITEFFNMIDPYLARILPIVVWILQNIGPFVFTLGDWLASSIDNYIGYLPSDNLMFYYIAAGVIGIIAIIVNSKWDKGPGEEKIALFHESES